ncbi:MAG: HAD-IA family hydrolase [Blastocatellia bacterium]|nr:HAD-IA family hydrolase [Blastocatellia bacterium]
MLTLIFDCDGVLADTERYGHLPAFNRMFAEFDLPVCWTEEEYGEKLKIGGGKERMASVLTAEFVEKANLPKEIANVPGRHKRESEIYKEMTLLTSWHKRKSEIYKEMVTAGKLPARPGISRIIDEALKNGWQLAVCSTSAQSSVEAVLRHVAGEENFKKFALILAGDVVPKKKPAPDIYLLAIEKLGVNRAEVLVVEDSRNGLLAATNAGLKCLVTVNGYTENEDFSEAVLVVSSLGDADGEQMKVIRNRSKAEPKDFVKIEDLQAILS